MTISAREYRIGASIAEIEDRIDRYERIRRSDPRHRGCDRALRALEVQRTSLYDELESIREARQAKQVWMSGWRTP